MATITIYTRALHPDGQREARTYTCTDDGGYVYDITDGAKRFQLCEGLARYGATLYASKSTLARVIRRHLACRRRALLRDLREE